MDGVGAWGHVPTLLKGWGGVTLKMMSPTPVYYGIRGNRLGDIEVDSRCPTHTFYHVIRDVINWQVGGTGGQEIGHILTFSKFFFWTSTIMSPTCFLSCYQGHH